MTLSTSVASGRTCGGGLRSDSSSSSIPISAAGRSSSRMRTSTRSLLRHSAFSVGKGSRHSGSSGCTRSASSCSSNGPADLSRSEPRLGVQMLGNTFGGRLSYLGGSLNGVPDGTSGDIDNGDSKDLVGRIIVRPFATETASPLRELTIAFAGSVGGQTGAARAPSVPHGLDPAALFLLQRCIGRRCPDPLLAAVLLLLQILRRFAEYVHSEVPDPEGRVPRRHRPRRLAGRGWVC